MGTDCMSYVYAAQGGGLYLAMLSALHGSLRGMPGDDSIGGPAAGAVLTKVVAPAPTSIGEMFAEHSTKCSPSILYKD